MWPSPGLPERMLPQAWHCVQRKAKTRAKYMSRASQQEAGSGGSATPLSGAASKLPACCGTPVASEAGSRPVRSHLQVSLHQTDQVPGFGPPLEHPALVHSLPSSTLFECFISGTCYMGPSRGGFMQIQFFRPGYGCTDNGAHEEPGDCHRWGWEPGCVSHQPQGRTPPDAVWRERALFR